VNGDVRSVTLRDLLHDYRNDFCALILRGDLAVDVCRNERDRLSATLREVQTAIEALVMRRRAAVLF